MPEAAFLGLIPLLLLLFPASLMAIAPPAVVRKANLKARLIVVGRVTAVNADARPPHFLLRSIHVVKGLGEGAVPETLKVLTDTSAPVKGGITPVRQGMLPVKVFAGALVVVYVNPSETQRGFFTPQLQGLSVVTIE